jgi:hypothetical protein
MRLSSGARRGIDRVLGEEGDLLDTPPLWPLLGYYAVDVERRRIEFTAVGCLHRLRQHHRPLNGVGRIRGMLRGDEQRLRGHRRMLCLPGLPSRAVAALDAVVRPGRQILAEVGHCAFVGIGR